MEGPRPIHQLEMNTCTTTDGNDGAPQETKQELPVDAIDGLATRTRQDPERKGLLEQPKATSTDSGYGRQDGTNSTDPLPTHSENGVIHKVKEELNKKVCPLWASILVIFLLITGVIVLSLYLCTVIYNDVDEKYDPTLFDVHRNFSGNFQLPNLNLTGKLLSLTSNDLLAAELQSKLDHLYRNSPALGRYFSKSQVYEFSDGPLTARYQLMFLMPAADKDQLTHFTLSREMVYSVFRQFLYDQEDVSDSMYIDPASLNMWE